MILRANYFPVECYIALGTCLLRKLNLALRSHGERKFASQHPQVLAITGHLPDLLIKKTSDDSSPATC